MTSTYEVSQLLITIAHLPSFKLVKLLHNNQKASQSNTVKEKVHQNLIPHKSKRFITLGELD